MTYKQTKSYNNTNRNHAPALEGFYDIPVIEPIQSFEPCELIPFNYALTEPHPEKKGVHFFVDDYQFERVWKSPNKYINLLSQFKYVLAPDFSQFTDWPRALNIFNHYRKHWLATYWQSAGINVIPTICWSDEESFEYCFDGEPRFSVVAIASVGVCNNSESTRNFIRGVDAMMEALVPDAVIYYGKKVDEAYESIELNGARIYAYSNSNVDRLKKVNVNGA